MSKAPVPAMLRRQVDTWADAWLRAKFSRLLELRAEDPGPFNYPIAVYPEWRGKAFYLNVRYRARSRRPLTNIWPACPQKTALRSRRCGARSMLQHPARRSASATGCPRSA